MPIFQWEDRYLTGVTQIDEHHRHLVGLFNTTYDDFINHASPDQLSKLFHELIDYATYHFSAEEMIMGEKNYPELPDHARQHEDFSRRVLEMHADYYNKTTALFLEILVFLQNWLTQHILQSDGQFGRFLAGQPQDVSTDTGGEYAHTS